MKVDRCCLDCKWRVSFAENVACHFNWLKSKDEKVLAYFDKVRPLQGIYHESTIQINCPAWEAQP